MQIQPISMKMTKKNQSEIKKLAKRLAEFKPTIIVIEDLPENDSVRQSSYADYIKNPKKRFLKPDERELLAYEVGRLSGAKKIYGIDFKEGYNYNINVVNSADTATLKKYAGLNDENDAKNPEVGIPFMIYSN